MKNKILTTLTTILTICTLALTLTACFDSPHTCTFDRQEPALQFRLSEETCENKAVYFYSCVCGKKGTQTFEYGQAKGHYYYYVSCGDGTHQKICQNDPSDETIESCTAGEIECQGQPVCLVCTGIFGEPKQHDFTKQVIKAEALMEEATCTTSSKYYYSCECGVVNYEYNNCFEYGEPLYHDFVDYISNDDATCEEDGTKTATCNRDNCYESNTIDDVDTALGHDYGDYICNNDGTHYRVCENDHSHVDSGSCSGGLATCTSKAYCKDCKEPYQNKLSHDFVDQACQDCGTKVGSQGLLLELVDYGRKYRVVGLGTCTDKNIVIPDEHNNIPVTHVDNSAFVDSEIESVWIPYSVLTIQTGAFEGCRKLKSVTFGENLKNIWEDAFKNCTALESVNYTSTIDKWVDINFETETANPLNNGAGLYVNDELVTNVQLTTSVKNYAFYNYDYIENVTISDDVKKVGTNAFGKCDNINKVNYLGTIDGWVEIGFVDSTSNPIHAGAGLYIDNELITEVVLSNATKISSYAFYNYGYIESVTIPSEVKRIGYRTFTQSSLSLVNYLGTIDEWVEMGFEQDSNPISDVPLVINGETVIDVNLTSATMVKPYAFENYNYLRSVNLGNSVESIESMAFWGCKSLVSLTLGDGIKRINSTAFTNCFRLLEVVNNSSYITIEKSSISGEIGYFADIIVNRNSEYTSEIYEDDGYVILASGQEKILANYVGTQTELVLPNEITKINDFAIADSNTITKVTLGENVEIIDERAFYDNRALKQVVLCNNLKEIREFAFVNCPLEGKGKDGLIYLTSEDYYLYLLGVENKNIETAKIDSKCLAIGSHVFDRCTSLKSVEIPNGVKNISAYAFNGCTNITSIELPSSINRIGELAFSGCSSLNKVNYLGTIDEWVQISFATSYSNPLYIAKKLYLNDVLATDVEISSATKISHSAFYNCTSIKSIIMTNIVTSIGPSAFAGCTSLENITLSNNVTTIDTYTFYNCTSLTSIVIPIGVTTVKNNAFNGCSNLTIYCEANSKPSGWENNWNATNCSVIWGA